VEDTLCQDCAEHRGCGEALQHCGVALRQSSALAVTYALPAVAAGAPASVLAFAAGLVAASVPSAAYFPDGSAPDPCADSAPRTATPIPR